MKPIYKKKVFAKGGNNKSYPINDKFWGYKASNYTSNYEQDVNNILTNNWDAAKKYMIDNNVTYAQTPEGFRTAAFDKKVGAVHEYIKGLSNQSTPSVTPVIPKKSTYTHTTDKNFYDSGQLSPQEKALYNPDTLTRDITKEEFDKAMKTNEPVTNSIGAGYRENVQYAKGGNTNKTVILKDKTNISTNNNSTTFTKPTGQKIVIPTVVDMSSIPNPNSTTKVFTDNETIIPDTNIRTLNSTSTVLNSKTLKPKYFAGGDTISTGLGAAAGIASMIPGGQLIGAGLGAIGGIVGMFNNNDKEKEAVAKQNALVAAQEQQQLNQLVDTEKINQRNYATDTPKSSFYAKGGNMKPKYDTGGDLQPLAEDGIAVNGKSHEQGGVDYGDIEVEKGETIKKEADGDFVFSTEFKPDGKHDAGEISKQLFQTKQSLQQKSGLAATEINDGRTALRISPSRIDSNTKGREVTRNQFKQKAIEQQIQQTDAQLEQLKQQQIQWGQEQGIYDKEGNNIVADQPLDQQEQSIMAKGGKSNISTNQVEQKLANPTMDYITPKSSFLNTTPVNTLDITTKPLQNYISNTTIKPNTPIKPKFNVSAGLDIASTLVNYASNLQTSKNMAKLQTPGYIPIKSIETKRLNMDADRLEAINQEQSYGNWAERNMANPQQTAIIKQSARNQTQQQLGRITQSENAANTQIDDTNASRNLQVQQINNAGAQDYNQRVMNKSISDIQNVSNTNAALLKDVRQGITNQETRNNENRMYELYKLQYKNTPGVARDLGNAMEGSQLTLDQWRKLQATNKPIVRKGGHMKPKYIAK